MRIRCLAAMGACGVGAAAGGTLVDSYSETNQDGATNLSSDVANDAQGIGQAFTAISASLGSCKFFAKKIGSPTGNATAKLYNITGTFGSNANPTGSALATSDVFDVATLTTSYALATFTFSGANQFSLVNATKYFITCEYIGGNASNDIAIGTDVSLPTHAGNWAFLSVAAWSGDSSVDVCFYVYTT